MKILQVNTLFTPRRCGGAEVFLERLSGSLVARGHRVHVACLSPNPTHHGNENLQVHEFALHKVSWPYGVRRPSWHKVLWHLHNSFGRGAASDIDALLESEKPDLVHTHNLSGITSAVWQTVRNHGIPLVHTIHDYALLCPATTMLRRNANCTSQCLTCRVLSRPKLQDSQVVDAVIGCSGFVLERHLERGYFSNASHHVIHNSDPCCERPRTDEPRTESNLLRIGFLGRLAQPKGIEPMLDVLACSQPRRWELQIAGSGEAGYEALLRNRYEPQGVRFVGQVHAATFLAGIDLLVVPSLWNEPCPLVLGEAMSAGVPIVASTMGGIPEVVEHGRTGLLFDPTDFDSLRQHVERLATDRERLRQMARCCRQQAEAYTFRHAVESYLNVYEETLNRSVQHVDYCLHR